MTISGSLPAFLPAPGGPDAAQDKLKDAGTQFEALLLGQMLRQVREAGAFATADDSANHLAGFAEEQLAQVLSAHGGLGFAWMASQALGPATASGSQPAKPAGE
jgi:Rod binding domain-containing protein